MGGINFTNEQKYAIAKFLANKKFRHGCEDCSHINGCQGNYWEWSKTCRERTPYIHSNWCASKKMINRIVNDYLKEL